MTEPTPLWEVQLHGDVVEVEAGDIVIHDDVFEFWSASLLSSSAQREVVAIFPKDRVLWIKRVKEV